MSLLNVLNIAGSALRAQAVRLNTTASNLANADSVAGADGRPYRALQVVFAAQPVGAGRAALGVQPVQIVTSAAPPRLVHAPQHPFANAEGYVTMPNVNPVEEMVNMISASRSYQNNVGVMTTARTLLQKTLALGE